MSSIAQEEDFGDTSSIPQGKGKGLLQVSITLCKGKFYFFLDWASHFFHRQDQNQESLSPTSSLPPDKSLFVDQEELSHAGNTPEERRGYLKEKNRLKRNTFFKKIVGRVLFFLGILILGIGTVYAYLNLGNLSGFGKEPVPAKKALTYAERVSTPKPQKIRPVVNTEKTKEILPVEESLDIGEEEISIKKVDEGIDKLNEKISLLTREKDKIKEKFRKFK